VSQKPGGGSDSIEFLQWCEHRHGRLTQIAKLVTRAPDSVAREELFQVILTELVYCVEMVVIVTELALEHRKTGGLPSDFLVPIDVAAMEAADADIHLQTLVLSPAAGAA
jgi:hypothetical protein